MPATSILNSLVGTQKKMDGFDRDVINLAIRKVEASRLKGGRYANRPYQIQLYAIDPGATLDKKNIRSHVYASVETLMLQYETDPDSIPYCSRNLSSLASCQWCPCCLLTIMA